MIELILKWIGEPIVLTILRLLGKALRLHLQSLERKRINETNIQRYNDAKSRMDRINASIDLLNSHDTRAR